MDESNVLVVLKGQEHPVGVSKRTAKDVAEIAEHPAYSSTIFFYEEDEDG